MSQKQEEFIEDLSDRAKLDLKVIINENRSTMLSVLEKQKNYAKVSIHRMFLQAPEEVLTAVADFIRNDKHRKSSSPKTATINDYIQKNLRKYNYTHLVDKSDIQTAGRYYDLQKLYDDINQEYFKGSLNLAITWYGSLKKTLASSFTFGQYIEALRLVKIHRLLDSSKCPLYFIRFVIYHEMLHEVYPPYIDKSGKNCIHGKQFKAKEKEFKEYLQAKIWEKTNRQSFFK